MLFSAKLQVCMMRVCIAVDEKILDTKIFHKRSEMFRTLHVNINIFPDQLYLIQAQCSLSNGILILKCAT